MAERRMLSKRIIDTDSFLDMPQSSQNLYFHLLLRADDDGFIQSPKGVMRITGCKDDDLKVLIAKNFLIPFDSGVVVIKHWRIHNYVRADRYSSSNLPESKLVVLQDRVYELKDNTTNCIEQKVNDIPPVSEVSYQRDTQTRLDKIRLDKNRVDKSISTTRESTVEGNRVGVKRFTPPSIDEIHEYCLARDNGIDANQFHDFYESKGWMVGKNKMKDWKAAVRTWEQRHRNAGCNEYKPMNGSKQDAIDVVNSLLAQYEEEESGHE